VGRKVPPALVQQRCPHRNSTLVTAALLLVVPLAPRTSNTEGSGHGTAERSTMARSTMGGPAHPIPDSQRGPCISERPSGLGVTKMLGS
jgi:hypothetical protein